MMNVCRSDVRWWDNFFSDKHPAFFEKYLMRI